MQPYKGGRGESGITEFEIRGDSITLRFRDNGIYRYDSATPGRKHVLQMQRLALLGKGLNTYVNKYVRKNYAAKLA